MIEIGRVKSMELEEIPLAGNTLSPHPLSAPGEKVVYTLRQSTQRHLADVGTGGSKDGSY